MTDFEEVENGHFNMQSEFTLRKLNSYE